MDEYRFCPRCGHPLERRRMGERERLVCPQCGFIFYVNPTPAAGTLVEDDGHVLLIRRAVPPRKGYWAFPAGYMEADESAEEAAIRETREETGLEVALDALLNVYSFEDSTHQRGVLILYRAHVVGGKLQPGDDAEDARWFAPHELPPREEIAFSTHWDALQRWLQARAVTYRLATEEDVPAIDELIRTHQQPRWDLQHYLHDPDHYLLVADDRGEIVGYAGLYISPENHEATIAHVFVHPHHRRWGIGSHLIEHAMRVARKAHVQLITTEVYAGNPGIVVYLKKGFEVCGMTMRPTGQEGRETTLTLCKVLK
ncbi:MAG: GNAT family N-acetyltransferase [Chloroflexi bacterium]|nr:GNAT family N-acetyltransferase [Chloroflexota bacterium]